MEAGIVTRIVGRRCPPYAVDVVLALIVGPAGCDYTEDELRLAWESYGGPDFNRRNGSRPWAYWKFEVGEERPEDERARLAELGLLRDDELTAD